MRRKEFCKKGGEEASQVGRKKGRKVRRKTRKKQGGEVTNKEG